MNKTVLLNDLQSNLCNLKLILLMTVNSTTEAKQNFTTHSDLSVEIKDNVDRLEVLRVI